MVDGGNPMAPLLTHSFDHSGSTREKEQPYILPWIVEHSSIMYDFTFTLGAHAQRGLQ